MSSWVLSSAAAYRCTRRMSNQGKSNTRNRQSHEFSTQFVGSSPPLRAAQPRPQREPRACRRRRPRPRAPHPRWTARRWSAPRQCGPPPHRPPRPGPRAAGGWAIKGRVRSEIGKRWHFITEAVSAECPKADIPISRFANPADKNIPVRQPLVNDLTSMASIVSPMISSTSPACKSPRRI